MLQRFSSPLLVVLCLAFVGCPADDDDDTTPADDDVSDDDGSDDDSGDDDSGDDDTGDDDSGTTSGSFVVLTYNVHGLPPIITGDDTAARMVEIGPLLNGFDVVGLQEDFIDENHEILAEASEHPNQHRFAAPLPNRVYGSGTALFLEYGDVTYYEEYFDDCNGIIDGANDCLSSKGFQMARLELSTGVEVDLYNSHLDAGGGSADEAARAANVEQLVAAMTGMSTGRAVIFLGDTNLHEDDPVDGPVLESWMERAELLDACEAVGCPEPGHIDRVLFRSGGGVTLEVTGWANEGAFYDGGGTPLSDHPAISAVVEWSG